MQTKKTRIRWIDNARGICVFCVLLAHCKLEHTYLQMIYTPFFLALFFSCLDICSIATRTSKRIF